ncbi:metal-sensing transcriptional repressor [Lentibacillus jeotgali]|nr:metal-sensing transcriptional repressor [Lentibacillus jeotgali]
MQYEEDVKNRVKRIEGQVRGLNRISSMTWHCHN